MTDQQLNERLAKALGGGYVHLCDNVYVWSILGVGELRANQFSPATSVDDLRRWVLPELERRGLWAEFEDVLYVMIPYEVVGQTALIAYLLTAPHAVLAAAALECLEADNAE